jgi:hypothetical protein
MSMTTDITGGLFGPTKEEIKAQTDLREAQTRADAYLQAVRAKNEPPAFGPGSKRLGRPGYYPAEGQASPYPTADLRMAAAKEAGAGLGEAGSYLGGAGAPAPIGVIRGTTQTYATKAGGPNLTEFATPTQAQQAWNREQLRLAGGGPKAIAKHGEFMPEGSALAAQQHGQRLAEFAVKGTEGGQQQASGANQLQARFLTTLGTPDPNDPNGMTLHPYAQRALARLAPQAADPATANAVFDQFMKEASDAVVEKYRMVQNAAGLQPDPAMEAYMRQVPQKYFHTLEPTVPSAAPVASAATQMTRKGPEGGLSGVILPSSALRKREKDLRTAAAGMVPGTPEGFEMFSPSSAIRGLGELPAGVPKVKSLRKQMEEELRRKLENR